MTRHEIAYLLLALMFGGIFGIFWANRMKIRSYRELCRRFGGKIHRIPGPNGFVYLPKRKMTSEQLRHAESKYPRKRRSQESP